MYFIGLDLSGKCMRPSGIACINDRMEVVDATHIRLDSEILDYIKTYKPKCVAIDAPLSMQRNGRGFRDVERKMLRDGFRLYPPLSRWMKGLTLRAIRLKGDIEKLNVKVVETHSTSSLKRIGFKGTRKPHDILNFVREKFNLKVNMIVNSIHVVDAIICALVALKAYHDECIVYRSFDGEIYLL